MNKDLLLLLKEELNILDDAAKALVYSYENCEKIGIKDNYTYEELDKFESLTSRFARLSDILIQKVFRLIDELDLETQGAMRDRINRAEKRGLIDSADTFIEIRMTRNDIAHEYLPEAIKDIFKRVMKFTPHLINSVEKVKSYCNKFGETKSQ